MNLHDFIEARLDSMLSKPPIWGPNIAVEICILQLLEMRNLIRNGDPKKRHIMHAFSDFIDAEIPHASPEALSVLLDRAGKPNEFGTLMRKFVNSYDSLT